MIFCQICHVVLGTAGIDGDSFLGNPFDRTSQYFHFFLRYLFVLSQGRGSSLHIAVGLGRDSIVKMLIQAGADVNLRGWVSKADKILFVSCNPTRTDVYSKRYCMHSPLTKKVIYRPFFAPLQETNIYFRSLCLD